MLQLTNFQFSILNVMNDTADMPAKGGSASGGKEVTIYSTPACHFCNAAKEFLTEHNVAFTDHNVAEDMEKRQEMMQKTGQMGVPVITVEDSSNPSEQADIMVGFDQKKLSELLGINI